MSWPRRTPIVAVVLLGMVGALVGWVGSLVGGLLRRILPVRLAWCPDWLQELASAVVGSMLAVTVLVLGFGFPAFWVRRWRRRK